MATSRELNSSSADSVFNQLADDSAALESLYQSKISDARKLVDENFEIYGKNRMFIFEKLMDELPRDCSYNNYMEFLKKYFELLKSDLELDLLTKKNEIQNYLPRIKIHLKNTFLVLASMCFSTGLKDKSDDNVFYKKFESIFSFFNGHVTLTDKSKTEIDKIKTFEELAEYFNDILYILTTFLDINSEMVFDFLYNQMNLINESNKKFNIPFEIIFNSAHPFINFNCVNVTSCVPIFPQQLEIEYNDFVYVASTNLDKLKRMEKSKEKQISRQAKPLMQKSVPNVDREVNLAKGGIKYNETGGPVPQRIIKRSEKPARLIKDEEIRSTEKGLAQQIFKRNDVEERKSIGFLQAIKTLFFAAIDSIKAVLNSQFSFGQTKQCEIIIEPKKVEVSNVKEGTRNISSSANNRNHNDIITKHLLKRLGLNEKYSDRTTIPHDYNYDRKSFNKNTEKFITVVNSVKIKDDVSKVSHVCKRKVKLRKMHFLSLPATPSHGKNDETGETNVRRAGNSI